ncbi:MAG: hypothetical protein GF307_03675 [candidate division Zixibacteria bacterium]|nr:hypothetical protein [candidate division Zixibacteria bacterium]
MKCYFYGNRFTYGRNDGLVSFAIPDYGIIFRTIWDAGKTECEYLGLLTLLRFLELNAEKFKDEKIEIFSDSSVVVSQLRGLLESTMEVQKYNEAAVHYRQLINYSIHWVPLYENPAFTGLKGFPPNPELGKMNFTLPADFGVSYDA